VATIRAGDAAVEAEVTGEGPTVVLLHGFPDSGRLWRRQVTALVHAGYRTVVPDQRGYGTSPKPTEVDAYSIPYLVGDVVALLDELGIERAHVVGHDWGAAVAWATASFVPDRVDRLVALSVGHPVAFRTAGYAQLEKSWYMLLFQFAGIAEEWLSRDDWAAFREWAHHPDADAVVAELEANGSLTPALNWYRANLSPASWLAPPPALPPIGAPTMGVWSSGDMALTEVQMTGSAEHVSGPWRYERIDDVGHWMQLEAPERVNDLLLDFLGS
jgi:pimeloyl-ACP methyl ester carboxylesterase